MPHRQTKSPYWWISFTNASGKRVRESSGTADFKEAKRVEAECRLRAHRQRKLGELPDRTFDEVMLERLKDLKGSKQYDRALLCLSHLKPHFTGRKIRSLTAEDVRAYKLKRRGQKAKDATIAKELWSFSGAIRFCNTELDWQLPNPMTDRVPASKPGAIRWLTWDEAAELIKATDKCRGPIKLDRGHKETPRVRDFIELGLSTGMRSSEMVGLEWSRVDFGHRLIYLRPEDQKSGVPGSIPLTDWAVEVLRRRLAFRNRHCPRSDWVFAGKTGANITTFKKTFRRTVVRAKLKGVSPHTLRHTFASWLVQSGVDLRNVRDLCRHADIRTTMRYAHLNPQNTRAAVAIMDKLRYDASMTTAGLSLVKTGNGGQ